MNGLRLEIWNRLVQRNVMKKITGEHLSPIALFYLLYTAMLSQKNVW